MTDLDDAINSLASLDALNALTAISSPEAWRRQQIDAVPVDDRRPILRPNPLIRTEP